MKYIDFFEKYKFGLLCHILKDNDLNVSIYFNNCEIKKRNDICVENKKTLKKYPKNEFTAFCENKTFCFPNDCLITEDEIEIALNSGMQFLSGFNYYNILWSDKLIEKYKNHFNWSHISRINCIDWSKKRIDKFKNLIDFKQLSYNTNIEIDEEFVRDYGELLDWNGLSGNPALNSESIVFLLLDNPKVVWRTNYENLYNSKIDTINRFYYDENSFKFSNNGTQTLPSISTNPGIKWDIGLFEIFKKKIDFWLLALFGNIDKEIIIKYGKEYLNINKFRNTVYRRNSDWYDSYSSYRNGWENLLLNKNIIIDSELLDFLYEVKYDVVRHSGDARDGFVEYNDTITASYEINPKNLNLSFEEFIQRVHKLPSGILSPTNIHPFVYKQIIKPYLLKDTIILKEFLNVI